MSLVTLCRMWYVCPVKKFKTALQCHGMFESNLLPVYLIPINPSGAVNSIARTAIARIISPSAIPFANATPPSAA